MASADTVILSIRRMLVPIRREGYPFVAILVFVALFFGWFWQPVFWVGLILSLWCAYFFRDPTRYTPLDPAVVVSPADGHVSAVSVGVAPRELGLGEQTRRRVSITLSLFDCHVNRTPIGGAVTRRVYAPGKLINPDLDKGNEHHERNGFVIKGEYGPVGVVQIAGFVARRIVTLAEEGDELAPGQRIGLIRFGSRVDVYLPVAAAVTVSEGQTAVAGETIIARFGGAPEQRVRVD